MITFEQAIQSPLIRNMKTEIVALVIATAVTVAVGVVVKTGGAAIIESIERSIEATKIV